MKRATHKQNHVMRGFCRRRGADVSHHTAPLCSWTLCNGAAVQASAGLAERWMTGLNAARLPCGS